MADTFKKGSAPWEAAGAQKFARGSAPWETTEAGVSQDTVDKMEADNEQHPDIGFGTRMFLQNFGNTPGAKAAYLKSKGFETKSVDDEVLVKKPGETKWRKLAPKGPELQDVTDNIYPIGSGIVSGIAGAGAAAAAVPTTGGVGSIPAAMGASGLASAGGEALRQKIGQWGDIPQEMDMGDVAIQGAAGVASPLLFGTGATAAKMAAKGVAQEAMPAIMSSQRGLVGRGADYVGQRVLPKMGEYVSGVPADAIRTFANRGDELNALAEPGAYNDFVDTAHGKLKSGIWDAKQKVGQQLEETIGGAGKQIDITQAKGLIDDHIAKLEQGELKNNPLVQEQIAALKQARNNIFQETAQGPAVQGADGVMSELPDQIGPKKAFELQHLIGDYADVSKVKDGPMSRLTGTPAEKQWQNANMGAYKALNDEFSTATEGLSGALKSDYARYSNLQKNLNNYFSTPEKTGQSLQNLNNKSKEYLRGTIDDVKRLSEGKVDIQPEADLLFAHKYLQKPGMMPLSNDGATSTSRSLSLGSLGGMLGYKLGGYPMVPVGMGAGNLIGSPAAIKAYTSAGVQANKAMTPMRKYGNPAAQSLWNTLYNSSKREK